MIQNFKCTECFGVVFSWTISGHTEEAEVLSDFFASIFTGTSHIAQAPEGKGRDRENDELLTVEEPSSRPSKKPEGVQVHGTRWEVSMGSEGTGGCSC